MRAWGTRRRRRSVAFARRERDSRGYTPFIGGTSCVSNENVNISHEICMHCTYSGRPAGERVPPSNLPPRGDKKETKKEKNNNDDDDDAEKKIAGVRRNRDERRLSPLAESSRLGKKNDDRVSLFLGVVHRFRPPPRTPRRPRDGFGGGRREKKKERKNNLSPPRGPTPPPAPRPRRGRIASA